MCLCECDSVKWNVKSILIGVLLPACVSPMDPLCCCCWDVCARPSYQPVGDRWVESEGPGIRGGGGGGGGGQVRWTGGAGGKVGETGGTGPDR